MGNAKTGVLCELLEFSPDVFIPITQQAASLTRHPLLHAPLIGLRGRYTAGAAGFKMSTILSPVSPKISRTWFLLPLSPVHAQNIRKVFSCQCASLGFLEALNVLLEYGTTAS